MRSYRFSKWFHYLLTITACDFSNFDILSRKASDVRNQFNSQRAAINSGDLYREGGSPRNEDVWETFSQEPLKGASGKFVLSQLKNRAQDKFSIESLDAFSPTFTLAEDLKSLLESLLE